MPKPERHRIDLDMQQITPTEQNNVKNSIKHTINQMVLVRKDKSDPDPVIQRALWVMIHCALISQDSRNSSKTTQSSSYNSADHCILVQDAGKNISPLCLCTRLAENGVQGKQLARDLLSVSALPAADRNQVLYT